MEIEYNWTKKYEIGKRIDAALLDGNGDHRDVCFVWHYHVKKRTA